MAKYQFIFICRILLVLVSLMIYKDYDNRDYMRELFEEKMIELKTELEGMK